VPRRPDRSPKHPTSTTSPASSGSSGASAQPDHDALLGSAAGLGRRLRRGVALTAVVAAALTGAVVVSGQSSAGTDAPASAALAAATPTSAGGSTDAVTLPEPTAAELARLAESRSDDRTSRSQSRTAAVDSKAALLALEARPGPQESRTRSVDLGDPRDIAQSMLADYGWSQSEFSCLDSLWVKESGWDPQAANPTSSAYGIPQALPGSKMASAGADWETNPATQIEWGLGYIADRYGSPCSAWGHSQANGWY
jgi:hypothetical protein